MNAVDPKDEFRISARAHFIACENGWRGTAYLYRGDAARPEEIVHDPSLCASREEAETIVRTRALARAGLLARVGCGLKGPLDEEACNPAPCPEK